MPTKIGFGEKVVHIHATRAELQLDQTTKCGISDKAAVGFRD